MHKWLLVILYLDAQTSCDYIDKACHIKMKFGFLLCWLADNTFSANCILKYVFNLWYYLISVPDPNHFYIGCWGNYIHAYCILGCLCKFLPLFSLKRLGVAFFFSYLFKSKGMSWEASLHRFCRMDFLQWDVWLHGLWMPMLWTFLLKEIL